MSAAASLTGAFGTIKDDFVKANPGATVTINFGSSGTLETQIESGAPVDVAAFADEATMKKLADKSLLAGAEPDLRHQQPGHRDQAGQPEEHQDRSPTSPPPAPISLCVETAPCGKYADQILQTAGVTIPASSITRGQDVKATLSGGHRRRRRRRHRLRHRRPGRRGEGRHGRRSPTAQNAMAKYPIAVIKATKNEALAQAFMDYVLGPEAQAVLEGAGFQAP